MSIIARILNSMKFDRPYTVEELAVMNQVRQEDAQQAVDILLRGGLLEQVAQLTGRVTKPSSMKVRTRQREFVLYHNAGD